MLTEILRDLLGGRNRDQYVFVMAPPKGRVAPPNLAEPHVAPFQPKGYAEAGRVIEKEEEE